MVAMEACLQREVNRSELGKCFQILAEVEKRNKYTLIAFESERDKQNRRHRRLPPLIL